MSQERKSDGVIGGESGEDEGWLSGTKKFIAEKENLMFVAFNNFKQVERFKFTSQYVGVDVVEC